MHRTWESSFYHMHLMNVITVIHIKQGDIVPSLKGAAIYVVHVGNITARLSNITEREQPHTHIRATSVCWSPSIHLQLPNSIYCLREPWCKTQVIHVQINHSQPEVTFISDLGIWKPLLSSSGCLMSCETPSCARNDREMVCLKGQGRRGSNSPFMSYEEGDMRPSARPIPVEVDTQAQLVAVPRGEEQLSHLPDVHPAVAGG